MSSSADVTREPTGSQPPESWPQAVSLLEVGETFGDRYRVEKLLGSGGMGAVYKAWDEQVDIPVALKVVRSDGSTDPAMTRRLDRRFKRELLLARQVTHKNVIRIHDMGTIDDVTYITMTYIDGEDLAEILERQRTLSVSEVLRVMRPALSGLVAAHEAGVVHRDLKPSNIMVESCSGQSYIMDFGIATSTAIDPAALAGAGDGTTATTAALASGSDTDGLAGTLHYMAPEQLVDTDVDQRADVYSFGLVLYDLLVGRRRIATAGSANGEFRNRLAKAPPSPRSLDPSVPEALDVIISRCLEPDAEDRFQTSSELQAALDRLDDEGEPLPVKRSLTPTIGATAAVLVAAVVGGTWWMASHLTPRASTEPMTVLVADFVNTTGDETFAGALEQTLEIAMEGAGFINAFPSANARRIAHQLRPGRRLDEDLARLVSRREGLSVILVGSLDLGEHGYTIAVEALDPGVESGVRRPLASARAVAKKKDNVLAKVAEVAADLRGKLGDSAPESDRLAAVETFTTASLSAMQAYAYAQDLSAQGRFEEALESYESAVKHDPKFGRAYAGLGVVYGNLRQEEKAEAAYLKAIQNLDRMSERERYRTLGGYYLLVARNYDKAIQNYGTLVELFPADGGGRTNLALAYLNRRDFDKAVASGAEAVELAPGNLVQRMNLAMYAMYAGDFETAIEESNVVLEQNPSFGYALFTIGRSAVAVGDIDLARDAFRRLGDLDVIGSPLAPLGEADLEMVLGRHLRASEILSAAVERSDDPFQKAAMLVALAEARLATGDAEAATSTAHTALALSQHESVLYPAGRVLLHGGDPVGMMEIATRLEDRLQSQTTALAGLLRGERFLVEGRLPEAVRTLRGALSEHDLWFAHFLLGRASLEVGHVAEAIDELDLCRRRRGEITDVFLVDSATFRHFPPALYWLARAHEALGGGAAAEALYGELIELHADADTPDPLVEDAAERLGIG